MSSIDPRVLVDTRVQLHYAIQFMPAATAALVDAKPDYSHAALTWNSSQQFFSSCDIQGSSIFKLGLAPVSLTLLILSESEQPLAEFNLDQKTLAEGFAWLRNELNQLGVDGEKVVPLSYPPNDFPDSAIAHGASFDTSQPELRRAIITYYDRTSLALETLVQAESGAAPVWVWPHHFDMATLITLTMAEGEEGQSVGVGFSPGDAGTAEPYWYVTPWPYPPVERLTPLTYGSWNTEGWVGALLTATELGDIDSLSNQQHLQAFIQSAVSASKQALGFAQ